MNKKGIIVIDVVAIMGFVAFIGFFGNMIKKDQEKIRQENMIRLEPEDKLYRSAENIEQE